jgi:Leucine-rich repeat (LRR) protein
MGEKYVFISYKAEEYKQTKAVKEHLEKNGIPCWMAPMSIRGGSSYAREIPPAIQGSSVFLLMLSEKAQASKWVPREVDQAINAGKLIMPYMLENCPLRDDFSFYLTNVQRYEAFRDPEETLQRMTRDIQAALGITPPAEEETPDTQETQPKKPESKPKSPKKEKKTTTCKKKKLPLLLGIALAMILLALSVVLLQPKSLQIGGTKFEADAFSVRLENATLHQEDVDRFSEFEDLGVLRLENCTLHAQDLQPMLSKSLMHLELTGCDLTPAQFATLDFSGLDRLSELHISGNPQLNSLGSLEACADSLTALDISDTGIRSFQLLPTFTKLEVLRANRTGLQDTALLEGMIYLEELSLSGNGITSLEGLKNTSKLSVVDLSHNALTDVSILSRSAACLTAVHLEQNQLSDLSCLAEATGLRKVYVDGNLLTELSFLRDKAALQLLSASHNQILSLSGLGIGEKMSYLDLSHNQLQAIEEGDLAFKEGSYLTVDLSSNRLQALQLPLGCTYQQLAVLDNPALDISTLKSAKGWDLYFDLPADIPLQTLQELSFYSLCIVGCPLDRQVELEEGLSTEQLLTKDDALKAIAEQASKSAH